MRHVLIILGTLVAATAANVQPGNAQFNSRWCSMGGSSGSSGATDCSYNTLAQCRQGASGLNRYCVENPDYAWAARGRRQDAGSSRRSRQQDRDY